jgi:hypothetical protein
LAATRRRNAPKPGQTGFRSKPADRQGVGKTTGLICICSSCAPEAETDHATRMRGKDRLGKTQILAPSIGELHARPSPTTTLRPEALFKPFFGSPAGFRKRRNFLLPECHRQLDGKPPIPPPEQRRPSLPEHRRTRAGNHTYTRGRQSGSLPR